MKPLKERLNSRIWNVCHINISGRLRSFDDMNKLHRNVSRSVEGITLPIYLNLDNGLRNAIQRTRQETKA